VKFLSDIKTVISGLNSFKTCLQQAHGVPTSFVTTAIALKSFSSWEIAENIEALSVHTVRV